MRDNARLKNFCIKRIASQVQLTGNLACAWNLRRTLNCSTQINVTKVKLYCKNMRD